MALIENIQREDLNPIEEATAYQRLVDEFHLTQDDIAAAVGKDRATVANFLRLLKLPEEVRDEVAAGRLSMGHARALLGARRRAGAAQLGARRRSRAACRCAKPKRSSSARSTKRAGRAPSKPARQRARRRPHARRARSKLRLALGTQVDIVRSGKGGDDRDRVHERRRSCMRIYEILTDGSSSAVSQQVSRGTAPSARASRLTVTS